MKRRQQMWTWAGILFLLATGVIHLVAAPDAFQEAAYKGWLFYANSAGALLAAIGIYARQRLAWFLGLAVTFGAIAGYVASRTIGLPMIPPEPNAWFEPLGVLSLVAEFGFMIIMFLAWRNRQV
ncbi:MAG: hypothetical protein HQL19_02925 [Candidatus Omnitrophica bacterium]|nr:hypothetical protein [Candidatus Omnitrophota bacterium]